MWIQGGHESIASDSLMFGANGVSDGYLIGNTMLLKSALVNLAGVRCRVDFKEDPISASNTIRHQPRSGAILFRGSMSQFWVRNLRLQTPFRAAHPQTIPDGLAVSGEFFPRCGFPPSVQALLREKQWVVGGIGQVVGDDCRLCPK